MDRESNQMTRKQAERDYLDAIAGANTAQQIAAFKRFGDTMHHLGWMAGYEQANRQNNMVMDAILGQVLIVE